MVSSAEILAAFREVSNTKQLDRAELHGLLQDGIFAALAKKYGPTVQAEVTIDEDRGEIRIVRLRTVVETVTDPSREISLEDARFYDEGFEVGDQMEEPIDFAEFGRTAAQAAKQRIIQRVRERERTRIRDEFSGRVGDLLSGEVQQIERGKLVIMLNKFREAEAIVPYREQNHREHFHQGEPVRAHGQSVLDALPGDRGDARGSGCTLLAHPRGQPRGRDHGGQLRAVDVAHGASVSAALTRVRGWDSEGRYPRRSTAR